MNGRVIQIHSECKNKSQFGDTVKSLRVYSSEVFNNDIEALTALFTVLVKPRVEQYKYPEEVTTIVGGVEVTEVTKFE